MGDGAILTPEVQVDLRIIVSVPCLSGMYNSAGAIWNSDTSLGLLQGRGEEEEEEILRCGF